MRVSHAVALFSRPLALGTESATSAELYCWLFPVHRCRTDPEWPAGIPRVIADVPGEEDLSDRCVREARDSWIACENAALEPIDFALAPDLNAAGIGEPIPDFRALVFTGSYPNMATQGLLQQLDDDESMSNFFNYQVSFWWANKELTQFSDMDLSRPACNAMWQPVKAKAQSVAFSPQGELFCRSCREELQDMWRYANSELDFAEFPFSGAKVDCFLGVATLTLTELLCVHSCASFADGGQEVTDRDIHDVLWKKVQLELEGLLFFFDFSLANLVASGWPIVTLLYRLGDGFRQSFGNLVPNECDLLDGDRANELFPLVQKLVEGAVLDLPQIRKIADIASGLLEFASNPCSFSVGAALLALLRAGQMSTAVQVVESDFPWLVLDAVKTWDAVSGQRVGLKRRFFYDALTTRWPWLRLLEQVDYHRRQLPSHWPLDETLSAPKADFEASSTCAARVKAAEETWQWHWRSPFQSHGEKLQEVSIEVLAQRLCRLDKAEVLFLSGTSSGYKWGSFTVRGRQVARGLRQLVSIGPEIRARAWNQDCSSWCSDFQAYGQNWSSPQVVVHVKFPCKCVKEVLANETVWHVYDHVDLFSLVPDGMDLMLAVTSLAAQDYGTHPSVLAAGTQVFWHPLHHSNERNYQIPWRDRAETVGSHTTHNDTELYYAVGMLASNLGVQFEHIDPTARFASTAGLVITPQQTQEVYEQFGEMDITVMRHAGCMVHVNCTATRAWFCDRYKTGQRLVNAFAVGLPAVFWHQQGFLDVIAGSDYPAVASSTEEALHWISELVTNSALRRKLRLQALDLAKPFALERLSQRLALILAQSLATGKAIKSCCFGRRNVYEPSQSAFDPCFPQV
ncbi:unnamed protein product [Effrenium voratum]|nr:unnamed protein product [Effrenium voratum]